MPSIFWQAHGQLSTFFLVKFTIVQATGEDTKVIYHLDLKRLTHYSATLTPINSIINLYEFKLMEQEAHLMFVGFDLNFTANNALIGTVYEHDKK